MTAHLSPSALLYLYCGRVIEPQPKRGRRRIEPPCGAPEVSLTELARTSLALSFWSLRERGVLRFERFQKDRALRGPAERVRVALENRVEGTPVTLEDALAARAAGKQNFDDVRGMIARSGYNAADPWLAVVAVAWEECAAAGLGQTIVPPLRKRLFGATPRFELGDRSLRDPYEAAFEDAWRGWERFGTDEPDLRAALYEDCARGLTARHDDANAATTAVAAGG